MDAMLRQESAKTPKPVFINVENGLMTSAANALAGIFSKANIKTINEVAAMIANGERHVASDGSPGVVTCISSLFMGAPCS